MINKITNLFAILPSIIAALKPLVEVMEQIAKILKETK